MPFELELEKDADGNIRLWPVTGCITGPLAEIAVLLVIRYAESPDQLGTGGAQTQFVLTPQQALEISVKLTNAADEILRPLQPGDRPN
jgi:hypothetical protein